MSAAYPFKIIESHKTYKVTFLQSVTFKIEYDWEKESYESFYAFFEQNFNLKLSETQYKVKNADAIRYKSQNGLLRMKLAKGYIEYAIEGSAYKNFKDSLLPFIKIVCGFIGSIGSKVSGLSMCMIDIWPLGEDYPIEPSNFISAIFSQNMLEYKGNHKSADAGLIDIYSSDDKMNLIINYLYIPKTPESKEQPCRLVLDTKCTYPGDPIEADKIPDIAQFYSDILYSTYHWCVTPEVIKSMES